MSTVYPSDVIPESPQGLSGIHVSPLPPHRGQPGSPCVIIDEAVFCELCVFAVTRDNFREASGTSYPHMPILQSLLRPQKWQHSTAAPPLQPGHQPEKRPCADFTGRLDPGSPWLTSCLPVCSLVLFDLSKLGPQLPVLQIKIQSFGLARIPVFI